MPLGSDIALSLERLMERWGPRLLSQACRDPYSASFGCFDRDWWHYHIRDFPSIILQQGAYTAWELRHLSSYTGKHAPLKALAAAGVTFWHARALRYHAFEEYYPWENGYPPLAFSTLAVAKLIADGVVDPTSMTAGALEAARQLTSRFEAEAANQQVAGLAALAWLKKAMPQLGISGESIIALRDRTLGLQSEEGWFQEYGGPDLGYLSVTLDCLWDLFDATGDEMYVHSALRAVRFIDMAVGDSGRSWGMHNARNTDYIVPYGIARCWSDIPEARIPSGRLLAGLFGNVNDPSHYLHAIDDRYLTHYIGHSVLRTLALLAGRGELDPSPGSRLIAEPVTLLPEAGTLIIEQPDYRVIVSLHKGGVLSIWRRGSPGYASDFGWIVRDAGQEFVTHWWDPERWAATRSERSVEVCGSLMPVNSMSVTPWTHMALRICSLLFGRRIIHLLKQRLIFRKGTSSSYRFHRTIAWSSAGVIVHDRISASPLRIAAAPRTSRRHVASADSYHEQDFVLSMGIHMQRDHTGDGETFQSVTTYRLEEQP
jgi:hypothetical protein